MIFDFEILCKCASSLHANQATVSVMRSRGARLSCGQRVAASAICHQCQHAHSKHTVNMNVPGTTCRGPCGATFVGRGASHWRTHYPSLWAWVGVRTEGPSGPWRAHLDFWRRGAGGRQRQTPQPSQGCVRLCDCARERVQIQSGVCTTDYGACSRVDIWTTYEFKEHLHYK